MAMEVSSDAAICFRCGTKYGKRKGNFLVCRAIQYKGMGYTHICKNCLDDMYNGYLSQCNDSKKAVRQMCRKLDLYWNESLYEAAVKQQIAGRSLMTQYIQKINTAALAGKSYDDTLSSEGTLWRFESADELNEIFERKQEEELAKEPIEIPEGAIEFWGEGFDPETYVALEKRRQYWMSGYPEGTQLDVSTEGLIRQIAALEVDIDRDRIAGKSVDKNVNTLNNLLGSANLKPSQQRADNDNSLEKRPFGVWIKKWEDERPIPEPDPEFQDVDGIIRYITVWFLGHLCSMLNIKNTYCKMYEEEIAKLRVEKPEYDEEDNEEIFNETFGLDESDG